MLYCSLCKNEKKEKYCNFCGKNTNNNYTLKAETGLFEFKIPLIKMMHKRFGIKKFLSKVYIGWQESMGVKKNKHPKGVNKFMKVDRENNRYREFITDYQTGEVIRDKDELLNRHIPEDQQKSTN